MSALAAPAGLRRVVAAVPVPAWWSWPAALAVAAVTWPIATLEPNSAIGPWPVGLHLAAAEGLRYGHDVVFTYGPLGFLSFPLLVTGWTGIASFAFAVVVHAALAMVLLRAGLRSFRPPVALLAASVGSAIPVPLADVPVLLVFAGCVWALERETRTHGLLLAPLAGAVAAFELLVKLNDGLLCLALLALAAWRLRPGPLRSEALLLGSFGSAVVGLWLLAGERLGDLATWARLGVRILADYAQGMQWDDGTIGELQLALELLAVLVLLAALHARSLGRSRGTALVLAVSLLGYGYFKEGFVRHDSVHAVVFFGVVAVAPLCIGWSTPFLRALALALVFVTIWHLGPRERPLADLLLLGIAAVVALAARPRPRVRLLAFALVAAGFAELYVRQALSRESDTRTLVAAAVLIVLALGWSSRVPRLLAVGAFAAALVVLARAPDERLLDVFPLRPHARQLAEQTRTLASGPRRRAALATYRAHWRAAEPVPRAMLAAVRGRSVSVEPLGATVAWAYGLDWRPEPVLESYTDYDAALDRYVADVVARRGASRILQTEPWYAIGAHNPVWDGPALVLTEICRYRRTAAAPKFSLLERAPDRCGQARALGSAVARPGRWVAVPQAGPREIVYATFRLPAQTLATRLGSLLYKPRALELQVPDAVYDFVPGTASSPHVMRLPRVAALPSPRGGAAIPSFRLLGESGAYRVRFFALPVR